MKRFRFAICLVAALACFNLQAQTADMRANIPFEFRLGEALLPAGDYRIHYSSNRLLTLREQNGGGSALMFTLPASLPRTPEKGSLIFNRYGETYFFAKIWTPFSPDGGAAFKTPREAELARNNTNVPTATVALRTK